MVKILVVDDELDVESLFRLKFRKEIKDKKMEIHYCPSGIVALDFLNQIAQQDIIIILSDINMPEMTGLELLGAVKNKYPQKKVFMVSAYDDEKYKSEARELGADEYITKPVNFELLKTLISAQAT